MTEKNPGRQDATEEARTPAAATAPAAGAASPDATADDSTRRLLLYEILLEEYETICRPPHEELPPRAPTEAEEMFITEAEAIKQAGLALIEECQALSDEDEHYRQETQFNGSLVARVYTLFGEAQADKARRHIEGLRREYEAKYEKFKARPGKPKAPLKDPIGQAVKADIYGMEKDLRNKFRRKYIHLPEKRRADCVEKAVLNEIWGTEQTVSKAIERAEAEQKSPDEGTAEGVIEDGSSPAAVGGVSRSDGADPDCDDDVDGDGGRGGDEADDPAKLYAQTLRSALCLSGGGIRSATFNLGILQGLARHGLLNKFDYLSTVSGGGFIGGWLTAWMHRRGTDEVVEELTAQPPSPLAPDSSAIDHLRVYSNYLSPQPGLLSADTWTLLATMLRNLLLTWLVFVPVLMSVLIIPRLWIAVLGLVPTSPGESPLLWLSAIGVVTTLWTLIYVGTRLPSARSPGISHTVSKKSGHKRFLYGCLLPLLIAAMAFAIDYYYRGSIISQAGPSARNRFALLIVILTVLAWMVCAIYRFVYAERRSRWHAIQLFVSATLIIAVAQFIAGCLLWYVITNLFPFPRQHPRLYAAFMVPCFLLVLAIGATLIAGFTSRFTKDQDQEWWARAGAWVLIIVVGWSAMHLLVLYGPTMLLTLWSTLDSVRQSRLRWSELLSWERLGPVLGALAGIISGAITLLGGFSGKTAANEKAAAESGLGRTLLQGLTSLVAPIFLAFVIILLALGTNFLLASSVGQPLADAVGYYGPVLPSPTEHREFVIGTPLPYLLLIGLLLALLSGVMGTLINTNAFSLHYMWRNRIIRAYLGASRKSRRPNPFTGFDTDDNIMMHELRPQPPGVQCPAVERAGLRLGDERPDGVPQPRKLFHVLNIALNLAGGDKLAWQDRKSESFTVSPLHAGSYWLGYRRSCKYGGLDEGISLGTAVAISGAFVSPNMGYMMTSPVVRFLMTLFNVRFGWWLGNTGPAGDRLGIIERIFKRLSIKRSVRPFELRSPLLPIRPIAAEAFGLTNDKSSFVYLSDGGHFENLGLYEMVLRRCRFIVVSDASTDPSYSFDSLAQSIRQIRVDLGVPIEIRDMSILGPSQTMKGKHCAIGKIRYSCVDRKAEPPTAPTTDPNAPEGKKDIELYERQMALYERHKGLTDEDFDGTLIYIKASMIGDEPRDVVNYGQGSKNFPQEVIVDQWFSEAQFESYRALGSHIIDVICSGDQGYIDDKNQIDFVAFLRKAREHNKMNFRIFKEQINYAAFERQVKQLMDGDTPATYREKVRVYLNGILK